MGVSGNSGFSPQIIHFNRVFHYKPSILGYPYFWKHPYNRLPRCFEHLISSFWKRWPLDSPNPGHLTFSALISGHANGSKRGYFEEPGWTWIIFDIISTYILLLWYITLSLTKGTEVPWVYDGKYSKQSKVLLFVQLTIHWTGWSLRYFRFSGAWWLVSWHLMYVVP